MNDSPPAANGPAAWAAAALASAGTLLALDLCWLGLVAADLYAKALGDLMRPAPYWPAALAFYALYLGAVLVHAVRPAGGPAQAAWRGGGLGLIAYATYELTNWAVLRDWPALLVPVDVAWGVVLTAASAGAGRWALERARGPA